MKTLCHSLLCLYISSGSSLAVLFEGAESDDMTMQCWDEWLLARFVTWLVSPEMTVSCIMYESQNWPAPPPHQLGDVWYVFATNIFCGKKSWATFSLWREFYFVMEWLNMSSDMIFIQNWKLSRFLEAGSHELSVQISSGLLLFKLEQVTDNLVSSAPGSQVALKERLNWNLWSQQMTSLTQVAHR